MKLFSSLTSAEKTKIRKAVIPVLERYRILRGLESINQEDDEFCQKIERLVDRLPQVEQFLITERYLRPDSEYTADFQIYDMLFDPPISERTYSKIRNQAMIKLALALELDTGVDIKI